MRSHLGLLLMVVLRLIGERRRIVLLLAHHWLLLLQVLIGHLHLIALKHGCPDHRVVAILKGVWLRRVDYSYVIFFHSVLLGFVGFVMMQIVTGRMYMLIVNVLFCHSFVSL